jgi:hypothetical protein
LTRYTPALLMAQTAAFNRHHTVDKHLGRWLILMLSLNRLPSNYLSLTRELIANIRGVRLEDVTEAAGKL